MLYVILEKAINHILKLDPDTLSRLQSLQGKVVKITVSDWRLDCYIVIQKHGLRLTGEWAGVPDSVIRGKLAGLVRVGYRGASGSTLFEQGVVVSGNTELGEEIREILRQVNLDGEEYLSRFLGDIAAHEISWRTKRILDSGKKIWLNLGENIREFCQVEGRYLPTRSQVEDFYQRIFRLREDLDRAEARMARLAARWKSHKNSHPK